jgi:hypothetical protein
MTIQEIQCLKSNNEIVQERQIECESWMEYINKYILKHSIDRDIPTFGRHIWVSKLEILESSLYAEYTMPIDGSIVYHESKIVKQ